jgi:hypothetical protein
MLQFHFVSSFKNFNLEIWKVAIMEISQIENVIQFNIFLEINEPN